MRFKTEALERRPRPARSALRHAAPQNEGAFYVWSAAEIDRLLGDDAPVVRRRFGIEDGGNAPADPQGEFTGMNLLYVAQPVEDIAARTGRTPEQVVDVLTRARTLLFETREARPRPHRDDKVIAAWNGLMIAAFARAGAQLVASPRRQEWLDAARGAAMALEVRLWQPERRTLLRRYRDGEAAIDGFCEDYACVAWGFLELFQATGEGRWLDRAIELTAIQTERFGDSADGGWFSTTGTDASVLLRLKEDYDGAEPAAASVTVRNLLTLGRLVGDASHLDRARPRSSATGRASVASLASCRLCSPTSSSGTRRRPKSSSSAPATAPTRVRSTPRSRGRICHGR